MSSKAEDVEIITAMMKTKCSVELSVSGCFDGDVSDIVWKAKQRNVQLLNDYLNQPEETVIHSRLFVGILGLLAFGVVVLIGIFSFLVMRWLWLSVQGS